MLINCTPHDIHILANNKGIVTLPASDHPVRAKKRFHTLGCAIHDDIVIPITEVEYYDIENVPPIIPGTFYIVSMLIVETHPERTDFLCNGSIRRDKDGNIICATSLGRASNRK